MRSRIVSLGGALLLAAGVGSLAMGQERLPAPPPPPPPEGAPSTPALLRLLDGKGQVQRVDTGYQATDGIVWAPNNVLIFTDPPRNHVLQWSDGGQPAIERRDSGGAAGLALDGQGNVLEADRAARRVIRIAGTQVVTVVDRVGGAPLGGPGDVAVAPDGAVYVADVTSSGGRVILVPTSGDPVVVAADLTRPAGLAVSIDGKVLYVTDSVKAELRAYPIEADGRLGAGRRLVAVMPWKRGVYGRPAGLALDREGRIYMAGPGGIWVLDANGGRLGVIATPETPSACTFGDADHKTLYLTAETSVYKVRLTVAGAR